VVGCVGSVVGGIVVVVVTVTVCGGGAVVCVCVGVGVGVRDGVELAEADGVRDAVCEGDE